VSITFYDIRVGQGAGLSEAEGGTNNIRFAFAVFKII
jgi:hypothetical protein